jgi:hypothetical protein
MNVTQFFQSQSPSHLTQVQKSAMYADFLKKREKGSHASRRVLVSKRLAFYSVLSCVALGSFFGSDWITGLFSSIDSPTTIQVSAQNIGTITESQWLVTITNNGRLIQTDTIQLNDQIAVADKASVKILINDSFQADIVGPATFEIVPTSKINDHVTYNLKFTNGGDYIAINTPKDTIQSEIAVQTTNGVVIKNTSTSKKSSFTVVNSSSEKNTTILNKSDSSLQVTKIDEKDSKENLPSLTIDPVQIVELASSDKTTDIASTLQIVATEVLTQEKEQNIMIVHVPTIIQTVVSEPKKPLISSITPKEVSQEVSPNLQKKDIALIEQNLYYTFLKNDVKDIVTYHLLGNENWSKIAYNNLNLRMERILSIMGKTEKRDSESIQDLISTVNIVYSTIQDKYDSQTTKINYNLKVLLSWLELIKDYKFGVYKNVGLFSWSNDYLGFEDLVRMIGVSPDIRKYKFR